MIPEEGFPTFGGLARSVTFMGVPLVPLAFLLVGSTLITLIAMQFLGAGALLFLALPIPVFLAMKTLTANDDKALEIVSLELLIFFNRRNPQIFNKTTTIIGTSLGRNKNDYFRLFEKYSKKTR
ncbi:VirB3 family type IV secretion system protein [Brackiella oedipodis]|uniref:VirB3 family type IV secretion system protein n=1 Tax=Brackiella oedipodis TaxID=124225 RepID=UPI000684FFA0|nr:VirB3 family type IV secretion system protein [Brackiella oedipodis]